MSKESKSVRYNVELCKQYDGEFISTVIEQVADELEICISHIGSYSR